MPPDPFDFSPTSIASLFGLIPANSTLTWYKCSLSIASLAGFYCARLLVPITYDQESERALTVSHVVKIPALVPETSPLWQGLYRAPRGHLSSVFNHGSDESPVSHALRNGQTFQDRTAGLKTLVAAEHIPGFFDEPIDIESQLSNLRRPLPKPGYTLKGFSFEGESYTNPSIEDSWIPNIINFTDYSYEYIYDRFSEYDSYWGELYFPYWYPSLYTRNPPWKLKPRPPYHPPQPVALPSACTCHNQTLSIGNSSSVNTSLEGSTPTEINCTCLKHPPINAPDASASNITTQTAPNDTNSSFQQEYPPTNEPNKRPKFVWDSISYLAENKSAYTPRDYKAYWRFLQEEWSKNLQSQKDEQSQEYGLVLALMAGELTFDVEGWVRERDAKKDGKVPGGETPVEL